MKHGEWCIADAYNNIKFDREEFILKRMPYVDF